MIYWFGVIGGFFMGFGLRGLIQNYIERTRNYHQDAIKELESSPIPQEAQR